MTDRCTLGPQGVGTWPGRARGRRAYKSSRRSSARRPCGGGPPFHPRLPTWSGRTVRSWDQAEPETADLSDLVALAWDSGATAWRRGGPVSPPSRGDVDTCGQGRIVPGLLGESPRA